MDDYSKCEIAQSRGPRLKFEGRLIASDSFETHGQDVREMRMEVYQTRREMRMEVYETRGGALIAVTRSDWLDGGKREVVLATVVGLGGDEDARHFAVLDAFDWHDRARSMVRNQLRWKLTMRVE